MELFLSSYVIIYYHALSTVIDWDILCWYYHRVVETVSNAEDATFSKKSKVKHLEQAEKLKAVAEAKAAKEREEVRLER